MRKNNKKKRERLRMLLLPKSGSAQFQISFAFCWAQHFRHISQREHPQPASGEGGCDSPTNIALAWRGRARSPSSATRGEGVQSGPVLISRKKKNRKILAESRIKFLLPFLPCTKFLYIQIFYYYYYSLFHFFSSIFCQ